MTKTTITVDSALLTGAFITCTGGNSNSKPHVRIQFETLREAQALAKTIAGKPVPLGDACAMPLEWPMDAPAVRMAEGDFTRLSWDEFERRRMAAAEASAVVPDELAANAEMTIWPLDAPQEGMFMDGLPSAADLMGDEPLMPPDDNEGFDDIGGPGDAPYVIASGRMVYSTSALKQFVQRSNLDPDIAKQVCTALERGVQARLDLRRVEHLVKGRMPPAGCTSEEDETEGDEVFHTPGAYVGEG